MPDFNNCTTKSVEFNCFESFSAAFAPLRFSGSRSSPSPHIAAQNYPPNPIFQQHGVKIEEQAEFPASQTQLAQQLCLVNRLDSENCVGSDHNTLTDQQSHFVRYRQGSAFIVQRQRASALKWNASQRKLMTKASLVSRRKQPGSQFAVHFQCRSNNLSSHEFNSFIAAS